MSRPLLHVLVSALATVAASAQGAAPTAQSDELRGMAVGEIRNQRGEPWAGVEVVLLSRPLPWETDIGDSDQVTATTDAQGRFHAPILRGRPYSAWVWGTPTATGRPASPVMENVFVQRPVVLREDRVLPRRTVALDDTERWSGCQGFALRVVDQTRNVRVAWVEVKEDKATLPFLVGPDAFVEVFARQGEVRTPLARVRIAAGDAAGELRIGLPERQRVTCWAGGKDCAGAKVFQRLGGALYPAGRTDAAGKLQFDVAKVAVQTPEFSTLVEAEGRMLGICAQITEAGKKHLEPPEGAVDGDLFVNFDAGETLHAVVTGCDGQPVAGARVWCASDAFNRPSRSSGMYDNCVRGVTTDARGHFAITGTRQYDRLMAHLVLRESDYSALPQHWCAGLLPVVFAPLVGQPGKGTADDPIRVDLRSMCPIELRITEEGGTPASDVELAFTTLGKDCHAAWPWQGDAMADQMGRLRILVPGGQHLGFRAVRGMSMVIRGFETTPGRTGDGPAVAQFQLPPPTGIKGIVIEKDGSPGRDRTVNATFNTNNEPATWRYEDQPAALLADAEHNRLRVLLLEQANEQLMLTALIGRFVTTDAEGHFALPLPADPVPGMLLFSGKVGARSFFDSMQICWTGESRDDVEYRVRF